MQQGYISLHRKLLNWEWFTDINVCHLFIYCLLRANYKPTKWRGFEIDRGEFITSLNHISTDTGLSMQQVRTALYKLKKSDVITKKQQGTNTLISIKNYTQYQENNKQDNNEITINQQTNNKQITTDNKENKDNKENNIISINAETKKIDPYINPIINEFKTLHEKIIGKRVYLNNSECNKLIELAADVEDFSSTLPTVFKKLKSLKFDNIGYKPNASWLLKENHYTEILNGAYDVENSGGYKTALQRKKEVIDKLYGG